MPLDHHLVEVVGLGDVQGFEGDVIEDEQIHPEQAAQLLLVGGIEPGGLEPLEEGVGAGEVDRALTADGDVAQAAGQHGLAHADRAQDEDVGRLLQEAQAAQLVPELVVEAHGGGLVPRLQAHGRVEVGGAGAEVATDTITAGTLVSEDELQEVLVGQLLLAGELEALGQGLQDGREAEPAEHLAELGRDHLRHRRPP